jgi:hypothetical protein
MESFFAGRQFVGAKLARINQRISMPEAVSQTSRSTQFNPDASELSTRCG